MAIPVSELMSSLRIEMHPFQRRKKQGVLPMLQEGFDSMGLKIAVEPLTNEKVPFIQELPTNFRQKIGRLTADQLLALQFMAPGYSKLEVGELEYPLLLKDFENGRPSKETYSLSLIAAVEKILPADGVPEGDGPRWNFFYGIDEAGTIYSVGLQQF